ncbi:M12 family metallopeptidase [Dyella acidiphila]|uniref:Peptidase M12A domain-containing protein n=1 Tax=Dyella acidiphila TaxID=2775866 RepID=A0ABR9G9P4_9GAMM|nr:M12 family metallopeptidase [Dyella acidiphila]MBE1160783.1 hypothetical protein [Dyella acidiphila]
MNYFKLTSIAILAMAAAVPARFASDQSAANYDPSWVLASVNGTQHYFHRANGKIMLSDDIVAYPSSTRVLSSQTQAQVAKAMTRSTQEDYDEIVDVTVQVWPSSTLTYAINNDLPSDQQAAVQSAVKRWNDSKASWNSNIAQWDGKVAYRFVPAPQGKDPMVLFVRSEDTNCSANLGKPGSASDGPAKVYIPSTGCRTGSVLHEMGHIVGLTHVHQRLDRNNFIKINKKAFDYLKEKHPSFYPNMVANYRRLSLNHGNPFSFDEQSLMMYHPYAAATADIADELVKQKLPFYTHYDGSEIVKVNTEYLTDRDMFLIKRKSMFRFWPAVNIKPR